PTTVATPTAVPAVVAGDRGAVQAQRAGVIDRTAGPTLATREARNHHDPDAPGAAAASVSGAAVGHRRVGDPERALVEDRAAVASGLAGEGDLAAGRRAAAG